MENTDFEKEIRNEISKEIQFNLEKDKKTSNAKEKFSKLFRKE